MTRYECSDFLIEECDRREISVSSLVAGAGLSTNFSNKLFANVFITNASLIKMFNYLGIDHRDYVEPDFCEVCGKEYEKRFEKVCCCSKECSDIRTVKMAKIRKEQKAEERKMKKCSITEIQRKAQKLGLTYGQYVARYGA